MRGGTVSLVKVIENPAPPVELDAFRFAGEVDLNFLQDGEKVGLLTEDPLRVKIYIPGSASVDFGVGDWVIRDVDGIFVLTDAAFDKRYSEVQPGQEVGR